MPYPRKTEDEKKLTGTTRKDRVEADSYAPDPLESLPEPPEYLGKTGRKYWKKCVKTLQTDQKLAENDLNSLGRYCMHLQVADEAAEELKKGVVRELVDDEGRVYYAETPNLLKIFNEASAQALKFEVQFGFTPVSRKNMPVPKGKPVSRLSELKSRRDNVFKAA